ncbi:MAG: hypothetical protein IKD04_08820 [Clostridia bacterium]|nr:hypothetical protein [Clostridia bacterium]
MKKRILSLIFIFALCLSGCGGNASVASRDENCVYVENGTAKNDITATEMTVVAENNRLRLSINYNTTDIEVLDKTSGHSWRSNAVNHKSAAIGNVLEITYLNSSGKVATMNSMDDSIKKGQFTVSEIENGVYVKYSFGDIISNIIYPTYISAERFNEFLEKMSKRQQAIVGPLYIHLADGIYSDEMYADFLEQYPYAKGKDAYVLREGELLSNVKKQITTAFSDAGYTEEDLKKDSAEFGVDSTVGTTTNIQFNVGVEYTLNNEGLLVRCPKEDIFWTDSVNGIEKLSLLPYFGVPSLGDEGYFLIPDGSGSIMSFYNGTEAAGQTLTMSVYGENLSVNANEKIYNSEQVILPIYGIKTNNSAVLAIIENGDAISDINAVSGTDSLAARIWSSFNLLDTQLVYAKSLSTKNTNIANASYTMEQATAYEGDIAVRYNFLSGDNANYTGMAKVYSNYLFGDKKTKSNQIPLYLDVIHAVDYTEVAVGFSRDVVSTITTFEQTEKISDALKNAGIERQNIILSGWQKNGLRTGYADNIKILSDAGGKKGLLSLIENLNNGNINVFPDLDVQLTYKSALGSNIKKSLVSRSLVQQIAKLNSFNLSTFQKKDYIAYVMTPEYTADNIKKIPELLSDYGLSSVSLRYLGKYNIPDYDDGDVVDRQEASVIIAKALNESKEKYSSILTQTGNAYTAPFMSDIIKLPLYSKRYNNTVEIPFTAMVYNGHVNFSGKALNLNGGTQKDLLKLIESNAGLLYSVSWERDSNLTDSEFHEYYSICFEDLKDVIIQNYEYVSNALSDVYGRSVANHEILQTNVVKVTYENGVYFIINYNEYAVNVLGTEVAANSYVKGGN